MNLYSTLYICSLSLKRSDGPCVTRDHTVLPATHTQTIPAFTPQPSRQSWSNKSTYSRPLKNTGSTVLRSNIKLHRPGWLKAAWDINTSIQCAVTCCWQDSYISKMTYKPSKLGHNDLVFGVWSEFTSRFAHARLQVCMCSSYDCNTWLTHRHTCTETQTDSSWPVIRLILLPQPADIKTEFIK